MVRILCSIFPQYGKTAKYYVYAPGDIDLNILVNRCKEMPRRREHQGPSSMLINSDVMVWLCLRIFFAR